MAESDEYRQLPIPEWLGLACPQCGYLLRGLPEHRCAECGLVFDIDDLITPVTPLHPPTITPQTRPVPELGFDCSHCGQPLTGATSDQCPHCGQPFDLSLSIPDRPWASVTDDRSVVETDLIYLLLRNAGIPCFRYNDALSTIAGLGGRRMQVNVHVPREFFLDAMHLIYTRPQPADSSLSWQCSNCGEDVPGDFDLCWKCESPRDAAGD